MQNNNNNNNNDQVEIEDAGASSDLPDESSYGDFLAKTQVSLARQGWELRGNCTIKSYIDALEDGDIDEILFIPIPGQKDSFYYFNRIEGWEIADSLRNDPTGENFLDLLREELGHEEWEYQDTYKEEDLISIFDMATKPFLAVRSENERNKFYLFYSIENL